MKTAAWKNTFENQPDREAALRMRAVDLNPNTARALVIKDLTHERDGWLYGGLMFGALGWF
jgi:hypothetical protein